MGGEIKIGGIVRAVIIDHEDAVVVPELAQIHSVFVVVDAQHIRVEPYLPSAERRTPFLLQRDGFDFIFGQQVASRRAGFDG